MEHLSPPLNNSQIQEVFKNGECVVIWDKDGRVVDINASALDFFGFTSKEDFHKSFHNGELCPLHQPDGKPSKESMMQNIQRAIEQGRADFLCLFKKHSGMHVDSSVCMIAGEYGQGRVVCALVRAAYAGADELTQERLKAMLDASPILCQIFVDGKIIEVNEAAVSMFGVSDKQVYLDRYYDFSPEFQPDGTPTSDKTLELYNLTINKGRGQVEWMHQTLDKTPIPCEIFLERVNLGGKMAAIAYARDMREQKDMLAKLEAARERELKQTLLQVEMEAMRRQQKLYDANPTPASLWDAYLNIVDCNDAMVRLLGMSGKDEYVTRFYDFSPEYQLCGTKTVDRIHEIAKEVHENGICRTTWLHLSKDKELITCDNTVVKIELEEKVLYAVYLQDMRQIQEADIKIREAEEFNKIFLRYAPFGIIMLDDKFDFIGANRQGIMMFEASGAHKVLADMIPEFQPCGTPSMDKFHEYYEKAKVEKTLWFEFEWKTERGKALPSETVFTTATRHGRDILLIYVNDLSAVKAAMAQGLEAQKRADLILETAPVAIVLFNKHMEPIDCNERAIRMLGFSDKQGYLDNYFSFAHSKQPGGRDSMEVMGHYFNKALDEGYSHMFEFVCSKADGSPITIETTYVRTQFVDDFAIIEYSRDISEIISARNHERERELNERIQVMFDAAPLMIEYWDKECNTIDCNQTTLDYFGFASKAEYFEFLEATKVDRYDWSDRRDQWNEHLLEIFKTGFGRFEYDDIKPSGVITPIEVAGVRTQIGGETVVLTYSNDVTALREAQRERQRIGIAEEGNRAKTRFLARMSHEIRTPITAIMGVSEIQLRNPGMPAVAEKAFAKIYDSSNLLLQIVNDILDFSKIETGNMSIVNEEYEVASLVSDATQLHVVYLDEKSIAFQMQVDENLPALLIGDELRLRQIINNLLSNAFKYTVAGSIGLSLQREQIADDKIILIISVSDTGLGMTKEQLDTLANCIDYMRFHERANPSVAGTGLGMPIVSSLLQMMGGHIKFDSEVGKGTNVTVRVPQKISGTQTLGKEAVESLQNFEFDRWSETKKFKFVPEPMPYGKVLIVDDVEANLYVAQGLLSFYNLQIDTCDSGYAAIERVRRGYTYDVVFMDHMMPGISGTETMHRMREMGYSAPIVALTANALIGQAEEFIKNGFDDFVSKPIQSTRLNSVLTKFIRDKQPAEVLEATRLLETNYNSSAGIDDFLASRDVTDKLRADFARSHKSTFGSICQALDAGDMETAHRLAHTLKGLAGLIKEDGLMRAAQDVEESLRVRHAPTPGLLPALGRELSLVLEKINISHSAPTLNDNTPDKAEAIALLDKLEPLLKTRNADAQHLLDQLRTIPDSGIMVRQIEEFEFTTALKSLSTLRNML